MLGVLCIIGCSVQLIREVFSSLHSLSSSTHIVRHTKIRGGEGDEQNFGVETKKHLILWCSLNAEKILQKITSNVFVEFNRREC